MNVRAVGFLGVDRAWGRQHQAHSNEGPIKAGRKKVQSFNQKLGPYTGNQSAQRMSWQKRRAKVVHKGHTQENATALTQG